MYRKVFSNFQRIFSPNLRTRQKQEKRFIRACRRVLNKAKGDDHQAILATARKNKFIFLKNQYVKFPIRHLVYKKGFTEPNPEDYPFLVPFYAKRHPNENKTWKNINTLSKHLNQPNTPRIIPKPPDTTEPYNPIPNMFIPEKYRDIIPKDPIYIDDRFITPGSREWFTYMYNLEKSIREQELQDFNESKRFRQATLNERVHREVEQAFERTRIEKQASREQAKEERKQEVIYLGTSLNHLDTRKSQVEFLMYSTDEFHKYIPDYLMKRKSRIDAGRSYGFLERDLKKFLKDHKIRREHTIFVPSYKQLVVSDDTTTLESRPNKRNINDRRNLFSSHIDTPQKRSRLVPNNDYDSTEAGPSNSK
ncbi:uncharacterized protein OCT59_016286 [Rhizophagus irregularis]|uniref:uncharacterized protein n=2 Tax=Rhizophagus irregularis TaxID=588596 RepID=UPI0033231B48|nr:hypothetical protein OCT59_016286 [Rhizophagus irregularis]